MRRTFYVVFTDGVSPILKYFKKDYRHVFVGIKYGNCVILLEDSLTGCRSQVATLKEFKRLTKEKKWTVISVTKGEYAKKRLSIWYWCPSCVNFVKNIIGIRCMAQTPYQLYKHLLSKGYKQWVKKN